MPLVKFLNAGEVGLVKDLSATELPANAWTAGNNIRMLHNRVVKVKGEVALYGSTTIPPYGLFGVDSSSSRFWVYPGLAKIYGTDGTTHTNLTRQSASVDVDYTATADNLWTGGMLSGILVLNNGVDLPQYWATPSLGQKMQDLGNWPSTYRARTIRPFKNFLVALGITKAGTEYPYLVKWSHPADPGAIPVSWDETNPIYLAGETPLSATDGFLVDCLPLGDMNILYKSDSVHGMSFVGGAEVFAFRGLFEDFGLLAQNCVTDFLRQHFLVSRGDVIIHNGQSWESILKNKMRKWLFNNMDSSNSKKTFVVKNARDHEIWTCFPLTGETEPRTALVWNWQTGAASVRDIPVSRGGQNRVVAQTVVSETFDASSGSFNLDSEPFNTELTQFSENRMILAGPGTNNLWLMDESETAVSSFIERTGFPMRSDTLGEQYVKLVKEVYPRIKGSALVNIYVGIQRRDCNDPVEWQGPFPYDPETDTAIFPLLSGRYLSFRVEQLVPGTWELDGFDAEVEVIGRY